MKFRSRLIQFNVGAVRFENYHAEVTDPDQIAALRADARFGREFWEVTPAMEASEREEAARNNAE